MNASPFPAPDTAALAVSEALVAAIRKAIDEAGGWLGFERFMQMALHEPGLGYYSTGGAKLGPDGDFTTAPELSGWLAASLASFVARAVHELKSPRLVELGAGSGRLARQLLEALRSRGHGDLDYAILETSADLRQRQQRHLDGLAVRWLDRLPEAGFRGIVVANEVADAIPVARFVKLGGTAVPLGVTWLHGRLAIVPGAPDPRLSEAVSRLESGLPEPLPEGYRSEICLMLTPWLAGLLGAIDAGGVLLVDYGLARRDYYRPERADGTLICHYRHRAHADPLLWPGLQDLSAWVDFSAAAAAARESGFDVTGFTSQSQFLLATIAADPALAARRPTPREASALKTLILPGEMGERFKLMWLTRGFAAPALPGRDFRNWL